MELGIVGLGRMGANMAARLVEHGHRVVGYDRSAEALERARAELSARSNAEVHAVVADVSTQQGTDTVAAEAFTRFGRVDVLVTNAGGPPSGPFEAHGWDAWERAVQLTLRSAVELTRLVLPAMKERRWGRIINVTSITVKQPVDSLMLSNSIRAAVTGFARTLATEVATFGITVNNILPGYTRTERVDQLNRVMAEREGIAIEDVERRIQSQIPMRRLGEPREFAALAAFLASERAGYITGQSMAVDGGWIRSLY
jgi:3-oxoacyl-[acyl-carrier protein] reductase